MSGFNVESSIPDIIDEKLKKYDDEDMIWIYNEVLKLTERIDYSSRRHSNRRRRNDRQNLSFRDIEEHKSIDGIKNRIKIKLKEINDREILESFFIETEKINELINNKDHFSFLKNNKRLCYFAVNYLKKIDHRRESEFYLEHLENPYLYIIYHFTFNRTESNNYDLERIKDINSNTILESYHNNSKNFQDEKFLKWSYSYLKNKNITFKRISYSPITIDEFYNLIVSFLDYLLYFEKDIHYSLTNQLYKAWSQRKFRAADKIKKPYHLPLTKLAKSELKKLSDFKNKTENEILEELIHQMYLSEMCDEDGKLKY